MRLAVLGLETERLADFADGFVGPAELEQRRPEPHVRVGELRDRVASARRSSLDRLIRPSRGCSGSCP